jgi:hypothetical protein
MTYEATLEKIRELAFPEYEEGRHSGAIAFKSRGRMFGTLRAVGIDGQIVVGLEPEHAATLIDRDPRFQPYPRAAHTVSLRVSQFKWSEIEPLVRESEAIATAQKTRAKRGRRSR